MKYSSQHRYLISNQIILCNYSTVVPFIVSLCTEPLPHKRLLLQTHSSPDDMPRNAIIKKGHYVGQKGTSFPSLLSTKKEQPAGTTLRPLYYIRKTPASTVAKDNGFFQNVAQLPSFTLSKF